MSSCSHPFDKFPFFYYKRVIAAAHSFKFTVFLQRRNCSKEILTIIKYLHGFTHAFIERSFVIWRRHFQSSIFCMIVPLFHGSTRYNLHVKQTVFILQDFLQPSIIIVEQYVYLRKPLYPCSFKGAYLFCRTSCNNFCLKSTVLNPQKH